MDDATRFTIGSKVKCGAGEDACGKLKRVVVEPIDRVLTHLVVGPGGRRGSGRGRTDRLVPVGLVDAVGTETGEVRLACTATKFATLESAEETHLVSGGGALDYESGGNQAYFGTGAGAGAGGGLAGPSAPRRRPPRQVTYERVPDGEVQVRRGERVQAVDGSIGRLQGLVADPGDHHVTHVLLDEGHLWTHKRVAIPIGVVADVDAGVRINLTKGQIRELPPMDLDLELEPAHR